MNRFSFGVRRNICPYPREHNHCKENVDIRQGEGDGIAILYKALAMTLNE